MVIEFIGLAAVCFGHSGKERRTQTNYAGELGPLAENPVRKFFNSHLERSYSLIQRKAGEMES